MMYIQLAMNKIFTFLLVVCSMVSFGQYEYSSWDVDTGGTTGGLGEILYGVSFKRFGSNASAPMVNLNIPSPMATGDFGTITHWSGGSSVTIRVDSFATGTNWSVYPITGTQSPSEFEDAATERGFINSSFDSALGMSVSGLSATTTYHLSMFVASKSFGTNDFRVITSDDQIDYTSAKDNDTYSVEIEGTTDASGVLYFIVKPLDTGTDSGTAELLLYCLYIRES